MSATERLVLDLPSDIVAMLREAVRNGSFGSESEALSAILRAIQSDDEIDEDIEKIRLLVTESLAEAEGGEVIGADEVHAELRATIKTIDSRRE